MASFDTLWAALMVVLQPNVLLVIAASAVYGLVVGAIPGLTATMATALIIPLTFYMDPIPAIAAIVTSTAMAITAGDIPGALLRIPGTPASAAYTEESYALTLAGRSDLALGISICFSAFGGLFGAFTLLIIGPLLAQIALKFSSFEFFWLALLGLMTSALVSTDSPVRGIVSLLFGLLISTIGLDVTSGQPRFTFGILDLMGGVSFIPVMIGMFAFAEMLRGLSATGHIPPVPDTSRSRPFKDIWLMAKTYPGAALRGAGLGTFVGALPGVGGDVAAWISYGLAKKLSKTPEKFGKGHPEGLIAATSSNNAGLSSAWIPALVFGIPGDAITAIAIGVLFMKNLNPGPRLFVENPTMGIAVIMTFFVANLLLIPIGYWAVRGARFVLGVPRAIILPTIMVFCVVGSFAINNTMFDVGIMLVAGIAAYILEANRFPIAPIILGIVLGPVVERNFIMSMQIADGDLLGFFSRPIAAVLGVAVCSTLAWGLVGPVLRRRSAAARDAALS